MGRSAWVSPGTVFKTRGARGSVAVGCSAAAVPMSVPAAGSPGGRLGSGSRAGGMGGWRCRSIPPEHPSSLLPGEGSKHHLVSLPGCGSPGSSLQSGSMSLPDLLLLLCLLLLLYRLLLLLPSWLSPEQWRAVILQGTPGPCCVLEEHQWGGMPAGLPAPAPLVSPLPRVGGLLLNSLGSPRGGSGCRKVGFSFAPDLPAYIGGSCLDPAPGLAAPAGSIPAPFSPCPRAAGGGRLPASSPHAAGVAGASTSLLLESSVIFSSNVPVVAPAQARPRLRLPPRRAGGCPAAGASAGGGLGAGGVVWGWRRASSCRAERLVSPTRGWAGGEWGPR